MRSVLSTANSAVAQRMQPVVESERQLIMEQYMHVIAEGNEEDKQSDTQSSEAERAAKKAAI